ncbi:MAG: helix-turn-helix domain-containing protein [Robiginitomaculum sp.]|nr:helix-turn-helix domain-containing protein [Robiginitomaculum sp.]
MSNYWGAPQTVEQAANYLGLAVSTLNKWRCLGEGPIFIKMGRAVRYSQKDLKTYIKCRSLSCT